MNFKIRNWFSDQISMVGSKAQFHSVLQFFSVSFGLYFESLGWCSKIYDIKLLTGCLVEKIIFIFSNFFLQKGWHQLKQLLCRPIPKTFGLANTELSPSYDDLWCRDAQIGWGTNFFEHGLGTFLEFWQPFQWMISVVK